MPGFGRFETVEELASSGPFAVFSARPAGESGPPAFAIKIYRTSDMFADAEVIDREAGAFIEAAKLQQSLSSGSPSGGEGHWAKVYELGRTEEAAYYVTDLYPMTTQRMVDSRRELDARSVAWIVGGVVDALAELGAKANGRGHGGLTTSNVLIGGGEEISEAQVALTDPEPDSRVDSRSQAQDLRDLAGLLFQLVVHRAPPKGGEIRSSAEWQRLGAAGELLRALCEQLLNPQAGAQLSFEQIKAKLAACVAVKEPSKGGMSLGVKVGIAALVLIVGGGGAFFAMRQSGPPPDPITPDWMIAQVDAVSGKLAAANKKANDNSDDSHDAEAAAIEAQLKAAKEKIETVRQHTPPQSEAELRSLVSKKTDAESEIGEIEKRIDTLASAIVVIDPGQDPRPPTWMEKPLADLNELLGAVMKDVPTEGEGGPDVPGLRQQVQTFASKVDAVKAKPWLVEGAEPAARNQAQEEIRKGVKEAVAEQKTIKTALTRARGQAREQLDKYLADQRQLNRSKKIVTSDSLQEAFASGLDTIDLALGWDEVRTRVARLKEWLKGIEADLPASLDVQPQPGSGLELRAAENAVETKRERALAAAAEPLTRSRAMPAPDDAAYNAKRAKIKEDYAAYIGGVKQVLADAAQIERLLSLGYAFDETPSGGKSIQTLRAEVSVAASYPEVRGAVDGVLQRAGDLEQVSTLTDSVRLMGMITGAGQSAGSVSPVMAAWKKLPKAGFPAVPSDLDLVADILKGTLLPALNNVGDPARKAQLESQARATAREMWFTYLYEKAAGQPAAVNAAFASSSKLGVTEADLSTLEPWAQYNLKRWNLLNTVVTVKNPDPKAQIGELQTMVKAFQDSTGSIKGLGDPEPAKAMAVRLKPFADGKDLDLAHEGPGRILWKNAAGEPEWTAVANDDGTMVTYSWKGSGNGPFALEFRRVYEDPAGESMGYLCTTEVSLGLFIDLVDRAGKWDELRTIVNSSSPDSRQGPRVWVLSANGKIVPSAPLAKADRTGNGWLRPGTTNDMEQIPYYPPGMAVPAPPSPADPMNYVSPVAALYVSHLADCRLPSSAEWTQALAKNPATDTNRRDKLWGDEHNYLSDPDPATGRSIFERANRNVELPSAGIFRPKGVTKAALQDKEPAVQQEDKYLWFAPVSTGGGTVFHHLVGNVAEYVFEEPKTLDKLPAELAANAVRPVLGPKGEHLHVIGASALSPKENAPETPLEVNISQSLGGYSDVGFRLAFSTGGGAGGTGKPAERLAKILSGTDYLTRPPK